MNCLLPSRKTGLGTQYQERSAPPGASKDVRVRREWSALTSLLCASRSSTLSPWVELCPSFLSFQLSLLGRRYLGHYFPRLMVLPREGSWGLYSLSAENEPQKRDNAPGSSGAPISRKYSCMGHLIRDRTVDIRIEWPVWLWKVSKSWAVLADPRVSGVKPGEYRVRRMGDSY